MRRRIWKVGAAALALSLGACGTGQPDNKIAAEDVNAMTNLEEAPPSLPSANAVVEAPAAEETAPAAKPVTESPAPTKPAATTPKPAETKAAEPKAPDPDCAPEHRAAGHC